MSAPDPRMLESAIGDIRATALKVNVDYGMLYPSGYNRSRRGRSEGYLSTGHAPDVSDLMTGEQAKIRTALEAGAKKVMEALEVVKAAEAYMNDAALVIENHTPFSPDELEKALPHPADRGDVQRAVEAQERRQARSGTLPWNDEVSG